MRADIGIQTRHIIMALAYFIMVGLSAGCVEEGSGNGNGTTNNNGTLGNSAPCSASNACPSGQFCWNGICAIGCNSNADCASDQFCDTGGDRLCHNKSVPTCTANSDCAESQVCSNGICGASTPPSDPSTPSCTPRPDGADGCDDYSICIEGEQEGQTECLSFPPCGEGNTCPTGLIGAVCNTGYIPNKAKMCLSGLCDTVGNCPSNWTCVRFASTDVLGFCSDGGEGAPCSEDGDCAQGNSCTSGGPGFPGVCSSFGLPPFP